MNKKPSERIEEIINKHYNKDFYNLISNDPTTTVLYNHKSSIDAIIQYLDEQHESKIATYEQANKTTKSPGQHFVEMEEHRLDYVTPVTCCQNCKFYQKQCVPKVGPDVLASCIRFDMED